VKYLTIVIRAVYTFLAAYSKPVKPSFQMFFKDFKASLGISDDWAKQPRSCGTEILLNAWVMALVMARA
jgi:hypothetical protein